MAGEVITTGTRTADAARVDAQQDAALDAEPAEAAVAEFGSTEEILAAFARVNPVRRAARRLLGLGPVVGGCWAAALVTSRTWPGLWPSPARVMLGLVLVSCIGLLAVAGLVFWLTSRSGYQIVLVPEGLPTLSVNYWALSGPLLFWAGSGLLAWHAAARNDRLDRALV